jgi:hypothetical protein
MFPTPSICTYAIFSGIGALVIYHRRLYIENVVDFSTIVNTRNGLQLSTKVKHKHIARHCGKPMLADVTDRDTL